MKNPEGNITLFYDLKIKGLVQGVGFRPFIYRLAKEFGYKGWVENRNDGVMIRIETSGNSINEFRKRIIDDAPAAADIYSVTVNKSERETLRDFSIRKSVSDSSGITDVSPDIAVCKDCLADMKKQPHRINYPFINCTNCGPRFSIIRDLPYDRHNTTMDIFIMCDTCGEEYHNIADRRFHAQPVACNSCGPFYTFRQQEQVISDSMEIMKDIKEGLIDGAVYAIKGVGGYHLMCDAFNISAVRRLRKIKCRDSKPFAVMFESVESAKDYAFINADEEKALMSWKRPVVLLEKHSDLAEGIADEISTLGIMMPYMPFHHLLFENIRTPAIVLTSGNLTDEPVVISDKVAEEQYKDITDGVISYNRDIYNRCDDSVVQVIGRPRILRRSRGYAPSPVRMGFNAEGVFGSGAELVNSFCMGKADQAILSQYIGDLKNYETFSFYRETYQRFERLFRFRPELIVCDEHPDYLSTRFAEELHSLHGGSSLLRVQHHHAHIASCMADNNLDGKVTGICFDGTGMGDDGKIWGAEILVAGYSDFERLYHFEYIPLPGGDKAVLEPWRTAVSYLYHTYGEDCMNLDIPFVKEHKEREIENIIKLIDKRINSPDVSSAGRLFDAVAALLQVAGKVTYHAEAPMKLESLAAKDIKGHYGFEIKEYKVIFTLLIRDIVDEIIKGVPATEISGRFHNTVAEVILQLAERSEKLTGIRKIVMAGGTFQNARLCKLVEPLLLAGGFEVFTPRNIPVNDQGIALGQLAIGAYRREAGLI